MNDIINQINSVDGLAATIEADGLLCITLDSSAPLFHEAVKHEAVGDIIDRELRRLNVHHALAFVSSDESASTAWYMAK